MSGNERQYGPRNLPVSSIACFNCRKRRKKCIYNDDEKTCEMCKSRRVECVVDPSSDGRRREAKAMRIGKQALLNTLLAIESSDVDGLCEALRSGSRDRVESMINAINLGNGPYLNLTNSPNSTTQPDSDISANVLDEASPSQRLVKETRVAAQGAIEPGEASSQDSDTELDDSPGSISALPEATSSKIENGVDKSHGLVQQPLQANISRKYQGSRPSNSPLITSGNLPISSATKGEWHPQNLQIQQLLESQQTEDGMRPMQEQAESEDMLINAVFQSFLQACWTSIAQGCDARKIVGPDFVDVEFFFRDRLPEEDSLTVSAWACETCRMATPVRDTISVLAGLACITRFIRWMVLPTAEHYAQMPEMIRPLPEERILPHVPTLDLAAHPVIRRALSRRYRDWLSPKEVNRITVLWHGTVEDAIEVDPGTGHRRLTSQFELEVTKEAAWS